MASLSADRPSEVVLAARVARQFYLEGDLQGRHRGPAGDQQVPGGPAARLGPGERARPHRDRPAGRRARRRAFGRALLRLRLAARVRVQLPRGRVAAAPAPRRGGRPGADGPDRAGRRARPDLVADAERPHRRAHPAAAVPDRPAHRGGAAARRPRPARTGPRAWPGSAAAPRTCSTRRCWSSDAATATAIRRQGDIAEAFALIPSVTIAVVSIGAWGPGLSTIYDAVTPPERDALTALGVRAELAGVFIGADGGPLATPLDSRMIVTPAALFTGIPFVLGVAYDAAKSSAVRAAIRGGLVHGLVTHTELARRLLGGAQPRRLRPGLTCRRQAGRRCRAECRRRAGCSCAAAPPTGAGSSGSATPWCGRPRRAGPPPTRCCATSTRPASTARPGC